MPAGVRGGACSNQQCAGNRRAEAGGHPVHCKSKMSSVATAFNRRLICVEQADIDAKATDAPSVVRLFALLLFTTSTTATAT